MISILPSVAVIVGAVPPGHFTGGDAAKVAVVAVPDAGCLIIKIKD